MTTTTKINERVEGAIPGIEYKVTTTGGKDFYICFLHKLNTGEIVDGLTNEDLITILIDRIQRQNNKKSDRFNNKTLFNLREAQRHLEDRSFFFRNFKRNRNILNNQNNE